MKRREFLKNIELIGIGCVAGGFLAPVVTSCGGGGGGGVSTQEQAGAASTQLKLPPLPFKYVELDPAEVASFAYRSAYAHKKVGNGQLYGCAYGTFNAIITELAQKVGFPYTIIPTAIMNYGRAGVLNWATLCGALNGCCAAIQLISPKPEDVINALFWWYSNTSLPTFVPSSEDVDAVVNELKAAGKSDDEINAYKTAVQRLNTQAQKSVSESPICHISVAEWLYANVDSNGVPIWGADSKEREDRCARLVADAAAKAVELLNQQIIYKNFEKVSPLSSEVQSCLGCHGKVGDPEAPEELKRDDTRMQVGVTCTNCHSTIDPKTHPF